jgi:hypothetical protein
MVAKPRHRVESMLCASTSESCVGADKNRAGQQWPSPAMTQGVSGL